VIAGAILREREETYGLFSPAYIPYNFIHMFLQGFHVRFEPPDFVGGIRMDPFGTSLTFASPFVILAFWSHLDRRLRWGAWASIVLCLGHIMLYHNNGWAQVNAQRYSLDFMPILILLVATAGEHTRSGLWKGSVVYAFVLNAFALVFIPPLSHLDSVFPRFKV
jgi:hypothetical protein